MSWGRRVNAQEVQTPTGIVFITSFSKEMSPLRPRLAVGDPAVRGRGLGAGSVPCCTRVGKDGLPNEGRGGRAPLCLRLFHEHIVFLVDPEASTVAVAV